MEVSFLLKTEQGGIRRENVPANTLLPMYSEIQSECERGSGFKSGQEGSAISTTSCIRARFCSTEMFSASSKFMRWASVPAEQPWDTGSEWSRFPGLEQSTQQPDHNEASPGSQTRLEMHKEGGNNTHNCGEDSRQTNKTSGVRKTWGLLVMILERK